MPIGILHPITAKEGFYEKKHRFLYILAHHDLFGITLYDGRSPQ